jgi:hypothetical protein
MTRRWASSNALAPWVPLALALAACSDLGSSGDEPSGNGNPIAPPGAGGNGSGGAPPGADRVVGASAGGMTHIISDGWAEAPVPYGDNVKMLNFPQMRAEVRRATGVDWPSWAQNRVAFGGADYVATFQDDRTPSATKLVTWRKMAFEVCTTLTNAEASAPSLFSAISPTAPIAANDPKIAAQVKLVFTRFFLDDAGANDVVASTKALTDIVDAGGSPIEAWTGLCVGYLSSMRFLTY